MATPARQRVATHQAMTRLRMIIICLALLLEGMSSSSINVQVDAIRSDLHLSGVDLQLVASAFLIAYAALLPAAGRLVDTWNRRTVFLFGVSLFGIGCVLCAAATSPWILAAGRFVQGSGAALSAPAALALITASLPEGAARNRAVALYGAMGAVGFSLGLVLPGAIVAYLGWRASFLAFVPVVLLVLATTWSVRVSASTRAQRIDIVGSVLLTASLIVAMRAIGGIGTLGSMTLIGHLSAFVVMIGGLYARGGVAGFPAAVVRSRQFTAACVSLGSVFAGVVASMYVLSLGLAARSGADAFEIGLVILPQPVLFSLLAGTGARLVTRIGPWRTLVAGATVLTASLAYLGILGLDAPSAIGAMPAMAGIGVALALCFPAASIAAVDAAPAEFRGTAAGLLATAQNVGGAIGLAVVTALAVVPAANNELGIELGMFVSGRDRPGTYEHVGGGMTAYVVSDLDGTLAFDGKRPVVEIVDVLERLADTPGVGLVLATSRSPRSLRTWFGPLADRIDLICCNGALVVGPQGELDRRPLPPIALGAMVAELRSAGEDFCLEYGDHFTASSAHALPWMGSDRRTTLGRGRDPQLEGVLKLSITHADPWAPRLKTLAPDDVEVFPHLTGDADVVAAGVTKSLALDRLIGCPDEHLVTALGNDANDLDLLRTADRAVVVGPGLPGIERLPHVRRIAADDEAIAQVLTAELDLADQARTISASSSRFLRSRSTSPWRDAMSMASSK